MKPINLAGCVIVDDYERLLLIHRSTGRYTHWEMPGGKIESGETAEAAAVRELREELGVEVRLIKALGSETFEEPDQTYQYHWFQGAITSGEPTILEPKTFDDADYFSLEDMPSLALSANMLVLYPKILSGEVALAS